MAATLDDVNTALDGILSVIDPKHYSFDYRVNAKRTVYTVKKDGANVARVVVEPDQNGLPVVKPVGQLTDDPDLWAEWLRYAAKVIMPHIESQLSNWAQPPQTTPKEGEPPIKGIPVTSENRWLGKAGLSIKTCDEAMVDYLVSRLLYNERFERQAVGSAIIYTIFQEGTTLGKYSLSYHPIVGLSLVAQKTIFEHVLNTRGRGKVNWSTQQIDQIERIYTIDDCIYQMLRYLADHNPEATAAQPPQTSADNGQSKNKLTDEDTTYRRGIVQSANQMRKETPGRGWVSIARDLGIPERTLRDWRHNPTYQ